MIADFAISHLATKEEIDDYAWRWVIHTIHEAERRQAAEVIREEKRRQRRQRQSLVTDDWERWAGTAQAVSDTLTSSPFFQAALESMKFTQALLESTFRLPDGKAVVWGEASKDDHAAAREMLTKQVDGIGKRIEQHDEAIRLLTASSARCINILRTVEVVA